MKTSSVKVVLAIVLLVALILGVSPKIIGLGIQDTAIENLIGLIPPETEQQLEIRQSEFSNGWFSSSVKMDVLYTPLGTESIALQLEFEISHGPLLLTANGPKLGLAYASITPGIRNDAFELALTDIPFTLPDVAIDMLAGFDQSLQIGMRIAPVKYSGSEGELDFAGLSATIIANPDQSAELRVLMGELSATENSANSNLTIAGIEIQSSTAKINNILAQSEFQLVINSISSDAPTAFSVAELVTNYGLLESSTETDKVDAFFKLEIADIASELPFRSLSWNSEINEIDIELFERYYTSLNGFQRQLASDPDAFNTGINQLSQELIIIAVQNSFSLNNSLKAEAYDGNHELDLQISWAGLPGLRNIFAVDLNAALNALNVEVALSLDLDAIMRSPAAEMVNPYVEQGYLSRGNGRIRMNGTLQDGVLTVNENTIALNQLF